MQYLDKKAVFEAIKNSSISVVNSFGEKREICSLDSILREVSALKPFEVIKCEECQWHMDSDCSEMIHCKLCDADLERGWYCANGE